MTENDDQFAYEILKQNPDYKQTEGEIIALGKEIIEKLGPDYNLFLRIEELFYHAEGLRLAQMRKIDLECR